MIYKLKTFPILFQAAVGIRTGNMSAQRGEEREWDECEDDSHCQGAQSAVEGANVTVESKRHVSAHVGYAARPFYRAALSAHDIDSLLS